MDTIPPERRSENMRQIRSKGMKPEMYVRRLLYRMGYRYRLHRTDLPGRPDIVFPSAKRAIFVHGCFWNQHSSSKCKIARLPKSRTEYWVPKLKRNKQRDQRNLREMRNLGWRVLVIWECQVKRNSSSLEKKLASFLDTEEHGK